MGEMDGNVRKTGMNVGTAGVNTRETDVKSGKPGGAQKDRREYWENRCEVEGGVNSRERGMNTG